MPTPVRPRLLTAAAEATFPHGRVTSSHDHWHWSTFAGRLCEFSGNGASATLTFASLLAHEAQQQGEPVAWVTQTSRGFFPPDMAANGVDLDALLLVRVPIPHAIARAADLLLRSGGFGLVVLDLGRADQIPLPLQTRLAGLARTQHSAVLLLTEKSSTTLSVSSMVSLRGEVSRAHIAPDHFVCTLTVLKDKRWGQGWTHEERVYGPAGLR